MFWPGDAAVVPIASPAPVPTDTISKFFSPLAQFSRYADSVAMRYSRNAGSLCEVTPPSTNTKDFAGSDASHASTSGGKKIGAAVLARASCHKGTFRLQSLRVGSLYLASGFVLTGHGESVVKFFVTTSKRHRRLFSLGTSAGSKVVSWPNTSCNLVFSGSAVYRHCNRCIRCAVSNICFPAEL